MWYERWLLPTYGDFLLCGWCSGLWGLLPCVERALVALDACLELGELALGGALGSAGHFSAGGEFCKRFGHPEGFGEVVTAFVDGGEAFVRVAADEFFADADLVELDRPFCVAALDGQLGLLVALHHGLEVTERVLFRADPRPLLVFETVERRRFARGPLRLSEDAPKSSQYQALPSASFGRSALQHVS